MTFRSAFDAKSVSIEFSGYMSYLYAKKRRKGLKRGPCYSPSVITAATRDVSPPLTTMATSDVSSPPVTCATEISAVNCRMTDVSPPEVMDYIDFFQSSCSVSFESLLLDFSDMWTDQSNVSGDLNELPEELLTFPSSSTPVRSADTHCNEHLASGSFEFLEACSATSAASSVGVPVMTLATVPSVSTCMLTSLSPAPVTSAVHVISSPVTSRSGVSHPLTSATSDVSPPLVTLATGTLAVSCVTPDVSPLQVMDSSDLSLSSCNVSFNPLLLDFCHVWTDQSSVSIQLTELSEELLTCSTPKRLADPRCNEHLAGSSFEACSATLAASSVSVPVTTLATVPSISTCMMTSLSPPPVTSAVHDISLPVSSKSGISPPLTTSDVSLPPVTSATGTSAASFVMIDTSVSPLTTATVTSENNTSSAVIKSRKRLRDECKWKKMSEKS